jgi:ATP-binding cassette subfamily B protein
LKTLTRKTLQYFLDQLKGYRWLFALMCLSLVLGIGVEMIVPLYYKQLFDLFVLDEVSRDAVAGEMYSILKMIALLYVFVFLFWRICEFANNYLLAKIIKRMYENTFEYLSNHSYKFFTDHFSGAIVRKVHRLVVGFEIFLGRIYWDFLSLAIRFVSSLIIIFYFSRLLGVIVLIWIVLFGAANFFIARWKYPLEIASNKADSKMSAYLSDVIMNNSNVQLFTAQEFELESYKKRTGDWFKKTKWAWDVGVLINCVQAALMFALEVVVIAITISLWRKNLVTPGFFIIIQSYLLGLFGRMWDLRRMIHDFFSSFADAEEMIEILETPHEIADVPDAKPLEAKGGKIEFKKVDFGYDDKLLLKHFDLTIQPGEKIALVGHSGEGKSTITKLMMRLFDVQDGEILFDDQNISQVTLESLRKNISLVPQEPILFHRSIYENISYGKRDATEEEVFEAARQANCHQFIMNLKKGYKTLVGERGIKLSGGERQRVAIARAILENAPLIILDEATSSLDSHSEKLIQQALHRLLKNKTAIIIAHRLSTIMEADRIIVIEKGKIAEMGTHQELIRKKDGLYKSLWDIQAGGFIGGEVKEEVPIVDLNKEVEKIVLDSIEKPIEKPMGP